jgi:conjugative relaxase-like TrwC/TraI family protein
MVGVTKIGRGNAKYWIEAVAEGGEDYYTKPGERPGEWIGGLAAGIGLEGEVDRDAYFRLLAGEHPVDGRTLVRRPPPRVFVDASGRTRKKEPILGHDVRFSAPKSVSLLWAIGSPEAQREVEEAVDHAVRAAYAHLEREACFVQRGKGGTAIERGAGFVGMAFLHRSSRAGDPALHVHVVTANMTRAVSDGMWLSLANPRRQNPLLREAKSTGYVFQAELRAELTRRLAVRWGPVVNGHADLEGIPRPVIDHFSRRRAEIVEEMERRGTSSAAAAEVAAYRTRDAKDYEVDPDRQRADWRAAAAEFDLTEATSPVGSAVLADGILARSDRATSTRHWGRSRPRTRTSTVAICSARSPNGWGRAPSSTSWSGPSSRCSPGGRSSASTAARDCSAPATSPRPGSGRWRRR